MSEQLNPEQQQVFEKYLKGENVFVTGPGGTGKSFLIKTIVQSAEKLEKNIQVCALTGCASILLDCKAITLHRFAGIGLANKSIETVIEDVIKRKYRLKKWFKLECLIIDEVSMMSLKILLILDGIARKIYGRPDQPFGGLQLIFSGDFYQLPPVKSGTEEREAGMFCFEHPLWQQLFPPDNQIQLKTIIRQREPEYLKVLRYVRRGKITATTKATLESRIFTWEQLEKIKETQVLTIISPFKRDVDSVNNKYYLELESSEKRTYQIKYLKTTNSQLKKKTPTSTIVDPVNISDLEDNLNRLAIASDATLRQEYEFLANNIMADQTIELKLGTYVMCIANIDLEGDYQIANGSQGRVVGFTNSINNNTDESLPIVKFNTIDKPIVINRHTWNSEANKNLGVSQIPLIYAWAITIHKAQGVTLDGAIMDIGRNIFEYGQTYVAISRVKTLAGLYLTSFDYTKIAANPKVKRFYGDE